MATKTLKQPTHSLMLQLADGNGEASKRLNQAKMMDSPLSAELYRWCCGNFGVMRSKRI